MSPQPDKQRSDDQIIAFSLSVPGWYYEEELRRLLALTRTLPATATIVEIGVAQGRSASVFLQRPDNWCDLYLIDPVLPPLAHLRPYSGELRGDVRRWDITSAQAAGIWPAGYEIDLLHIDGDHGPAVWDDLRLWLPHVRVGGVVVCHDYGKIDEYPEVTRAVDAHLSGPEWEQIGAVVGSQFAARRVS